MLDTLFLRTLRAYGIDPMNVPQQALVEHTEHGLTVEQFKLDHVGNPIVNKAGEALETERHTYPHPTDQASPA